MIAWTCFRLWLQELEKALGCKYVAANAVTALQQVYQLMGNSPGEKGAALQSWARILLKPELGRVVEACQILEQLALEQVQHGAAFPAAQGQMAAFAANGCLEDCPVKERGFAAAHIPGCLHDLGCCIGCSGVQV